MRTDFVLSRVGRNQEVSAARLKKGSIPPILLLIAFAEAFRFLMHLYGGIDDNDKRQHIPVWEYFIFTRQVIIFSHQY